MASEKKALGRTIVVAVDSSKRSDAAFQRALQEVHTDDCLLIVFARPVRSGDRSYVTATKGVQSVYDKLSAKVLNKYSALATVAKVTFEAIEIEGHHADAAVADKCMEIGADLLIKPAAPSAVQRFVHGKEPLGNVCPACNPYLRGHGRLVQGHPCNMKRVVVQPCPVIVAGQGSGSYEDFQMQGGEYALLRPLVC